MADLKLNDPVFVSHKSSSKQLEGVVAFLGDVQFAEGDDWVGIRLTGTSAMQGKNNGSVKGVDYFQVPNPNGGLFVRKAAVTKRTLSKLEELRLRRELEGVADTSERGMRSRSRSKSPIPGGGGGSTPFQPGSLPPSGASSGALGTSSSGMGTSGRGKSRLEELRLRRAALTTADATTAKPGGDTSKLEQELQTKNQQISSLEDEIFQLKKQNQLDQNKIEQLEEELTAAAKTTTGGETKPKAAFSTELDIPPVFMDDDDDDELDLDGTKAKQLKQANKELEQKVNALGEENNSMKLQLHALEKDIKELKDNHETILSKKETQIMSMSAELHALQDTASATQQRDASSYKELAKSQAEYSALKRKYEQLNEEKITLESNVEDLTLDKEQLIEEKDAIEERCEELKIDIETSQMECEELRIELESARAAAASAEASLVQARLGTPSTPTTPASPGTTEAVAAANNEAEGMAQALATQNARLREALIRLREQSSMEKMELTRQLKHAEKAAENATKLSQQIESMKANQRSTEEQIEDLKDMVEQGAAFEGMVEDLSDRLLSLEEDNSQLRATIRELEEAAELTAEMEEVQSEELKALNRDLENRDSVVRNLEEAIKMQRRREEDFSKTLGNYRTMVETLKKEKEALLELQQGGEGEKTSIIASSQKALARAAQLVSDAAEMRKREAQACMDRIEMQIQRHLAIRYERLIPRSVASLEISAVKGELLACKVAGMTSESLKGIALSFTKTLRITSLEVTGSIGSSAVTAAIADGAVADVAEGPSGDEQEVAAAEEPTPEVVVALQLTDESKQEVATMTYQTECSHILINTSMDLILRLLLAGHWPDLLSQEASTELGVLLGHSMTDLDRELRVILKSLKEEGVMSPHQTSMNINDLKESMQQTTDNLLSDIKESNIQIPSDWSPPGLKLFQSSAIAKFTSLGVGAIIASAVKEVANTNNDTRLIAAIKSLLNKLGQLGTESTNACTRLAHVVNVENTDNISKLHDCVKAWKDSSDKLFSIVRAVFCATTEASLTSATTSINSTITLDKIISCEKSTDHVLRNLSQFSSLLRISNKNIQITDTSTSRTTSSSSTNTSKWLHHALSPETDDIWLGISRMVKSIRKMDGDEDDVNFLFRSRTIESRLNNAIESEPKLSLANAKVTSLEKSLNSRSKEIAMQNARLSELEKLLAKTSSSRPSPGKKSATLKSSEELNSLKEENRVLMEAMDVLQRQVDEYENEIRLLKDMKSPGKKSSRMPRRAVTSISDYSTTDNRRGGVGSSSASSSSSPYDSTNANSDQAFLGSSAAIGALEAALFRPALHSALRDVNRWKGKALTTSLLELPQLSLPPVTQRMDKKSSSEAKEESKTDFGADTDDYNYDGDPISSGLFKLSSALSDFRMEQASIQIVNLSVPNKSSRSQLRESNAAKVAAARKLDEATAYVKRCFTDNYGGDAIRTTLQQEQSQLPLLGKVHLQGDEPYRNASTMVSKEDLYQLQLHMLR